jgi:hypothetical protein
VPSSGDQTIKRKPCFRVQAHIWEIRRLKESHIFGRFKSDQKITRKPGLGRYKRSEDQKKARPLDDVHEIGILKEKTTGRYDKSDD